MNLLSHLARASHKLLSLKSVFFSIEDDCIDERDCRFIYSSCDIDFETVGAITSWCFIELVTLMLK